MAWYNAPTLDTVVGKGKISDGGTADPKARAHKSLKKAGGQASSSFKRASGKTAANKRRDKLKEQEAARAKKRESYDKKAIKAQKSLYASDSGRGKEIRGAISDIQGFDTSAEQDRLRAIGMSPGDTAVATGLLDKQAAEEGIRREQAQKAGETQAASAYSNLAQQGGAGPGARERLLGQTGQQSLEQQQELRRQGALQRLGIQSDDATRKEESLRAASGLDIESQKSNMIAAQARQQALQNQGQYETQGLLGARGLANSIFGSSQLAGAQKDFAASQAGAGSKGFGAAFPALGSAYYGS